MSLRSGYAPPVPKMPPGLVDLMDGLARDVLRNNPENIYDFCAHHMQRLLEMRDGYGPKPFTTLKQRIAKAQKIIKQREEERRRVYDEQLLSKSKDTSNTQIILMQSNVPYDVIDDSEYSKTKAIEEEEVTSGIYTEESDVISARVICDISDQEAILDSVAEKQIKEVTEITNICHGEALNVINSDVNENNGNLSNVHTHTDDENFIEGLENNLVEEARKKETDVELDTNYSDKNDDTINETENNPILLLPCTGDSHEATAIKPIDSQVSSDNLEVIAENDGEMQKQIEVEKTENHIEEVFPAISDNISNDDNINTEHFETPKSFLPVSDSLNQHDNDVQKISFNKFDKELCENDTENLSEPEKPREDDQIVAIILSTKSSKVDSDHSSEITNVPNNEHDQKVKELLEITDDITHNINNSMDLEKAAVTIQKVFRSFLFKTKTSSYDDPTTVDINLLNEDKEKEETDASSINLKDRRSLGITRMDTVLQTVNEEKSLSLSTDDSSTLSSAATIIQAHVRGFLVRNKINLNNTASTNSLIDSDAPSIPSLDADSDNRKNKTVLNIHIVPEGGHFVSRDESILTSMDLSLDNSPPSSVNLHPLGYDKSERRKQLKREDAIQSVSPPSNNSGKLSDDLDSIKEVLLVGTNTASEHPIKDENDTTNSALDSLITGDGKVLTENKYPIVENLTADTASDEMDVISPFIPVEGRSSRESDNSSKLLHSGEFHDVIVPTNVTRSDTSVVREFQNVLVYFILWNN